jgi:hypothetical protein
MCCAQSPGPAPPPGPTLVQHGVLGLRGLVTNSMGSAAHGPCHGINLSVFLGGEEGHRC